MNPAAGTADAEAVEAALASVPDWDVTETVDEGHARALAESAVHDGYGRIVAAGGDGTVNEVVQAIATRPSSAALGVLPMGTGNDLARTLGIPLDPLEAVALIRGGRERLLDLVKVESGGSARWCINVSTGGFGGEVDLVLEDGRLKETWGPFAYLLAAIKAKREMKAYETSMWLDESPVETIAALAVVVANARTVGGGLRVAPLADPEDGLLDVTIIRHGTMLELAGLAARLASGTIWQSPHVIHRRGRRMRLESDPKMWFNVDGELLTQEPVSFTVVPKMIRVAVGPDYHRDPSFP